MVVNLVNSVEFYSHLKSSGYMDGFRRIDSVRSPAGSRNSSSGSNTVNPDRIASEKIGSGVTSETKTRGVYIDVLYPNLSKGSPASKMSDSFKSTMDYQINRPDLDTIITTKTNTRRSDKPAVEYSFNKSYGVDENGYVLTVPNEHLDMLNKNRSDTPQNKLYEAFTNNFSRTGSLVNVTA